MCFYLNHEKGMALVINIIKTNYYHIKSKND